MANGLYRTKNGWANEDSVRVRYDDGKELDVPASQYITDGYDPPLEELPWSNGDA